MKSAIIALMLMALLNGCDHIASEAPAQSKALVLPDIKKYTPEIQDKAAVEAQSNSCPVLSKIFMPDYLVMRDETRIAKKELQK